MITKYHYLGIGAALALAFAGGRMSAGKNVVYKEREVVKWREKESSKTNAVATTTEGPSVLVKWRERIVAQPGGIQIVDRWHEREDKGPKTTKKEEQTVFIREVEVEKIRDVVRIVTNVPVWSVSLQAGASIPEPWISSPGAPHVVVGASVDRKIIGPVTAGLWINTVGAAGVSIGARF